MIFSTFWFLVATTIFYFLYALAGNPVLRTTLLIAFCVVFHFRFAGPAGVMPIIALGLITYLVGRSAKRTACTLGIIFCIGALAFYKYVHFICLECLGSINPALGHRLDAGLTSYLPTAAPLAISFFVFEFVHYLWEVRRGGEPIRKPQDFVQFAIFFPSLVAGPIKRYTQFLPSLSLSKASFNGGTFAVGLTRVAAGFFKKLVLADNLALYTDAFLPNLAAISMPDRWLFLFGLGFRIYFDFSGYSDIAIGLAQMMGVKLPPNFNWPYVSSNLQEFWSRWHISLSSWIRDYIYIPLGGSRHGKLRRLMNGLIAFALCGLWHGAALHFLLWGLYHGFGLAVSTTYRASLGRIGGIIGIAFDRIPMLARAVTFIYVNLGWLLFFYPPSKAWELTQLLFNPAIKSL